MWTSLSLTLALLAGAASARTPRATELTSEYTYERYVGDFGKSATAEGKRRFEANLKEILAHNAAGTSSYKKGINQFTDEAAPPMGRAPSHKHAGKHRKPLPAGLLSSVTDLPASVDWRDQAVVSPVKNQGQCGSCWAFATTATVESHVAIQTGKLFSLSPQQLVSCAPNDEHCGGFGGCMGSIPELAMDYLVDAGGMAEEWSAPYISYYGTTNGTCETQYFSRITISGYVKLPENNASAVMAALATVGPLAINIDASTWHDYESGIYDGCSYDDMDIDHVVVLVGYGTDPELGDYWLVRNSWSPTWGEDGYIRLKRDPVDDTPCGVDEQPQDGTGCDGDGTQYPCGQCGTVFDVSYPLDAGLA